MVCFILYWFFIGGQLDSTHNCVQQLLGALSSGGNTKHKSLSIGACFFIYYWFYIGYILVASWLLPTTVCSKRLGHWEVVGIPNIKAWPLSMGAICTLLYFICYMHPVILVSCLLPTTVCSKRVGHWSVVGIPNIKACPLGAICTLLYVICYMHPVILVSWLLPTAVCSKRLGHWALVGIPNSCPPSLGAIYRSLFQLTFESNYRSWQQFSSRRTVVPHWRFVCPSFDLGLDSRHVSALIWHIIGVAGHACCDSF